MKPKVILLVLTAIIFFSTNLLMAQEPCITNAWEAYNAGRYINAIRYADQCINNDFEARAARIQHRLDSLNITPGVGKVNDIEKNKIFQNGLLNDVATACYVKGRSAEALYRQNTNGNRAYRQIAIDAYELVCRRYSKGRCWDPQGWFWSPCEAASVRLPVQ